MAIDTELVRASMSDFLRLMHTFQKLEKQPLYFGTADLLYPTEIHTIDEIGTRRAETVTALCARFGVTKGAASQIVTKLHAKGYVEKLRNDENPKEILLSLTATGMIAFKTHKAMHEAMDKALVAQFADFTPSDLASFQKALARIETHVSKYLALGKGKKGK
jgi:DNA-binding MarR family transcriptional regulator